MAKLQAGVLTREQAIGHGFGAPSLRRLVRDGHWQRLARGVYLTSPLKPDWTANAWAGVLIGGDQARLGGLAAAYQERLTEPPDELLVLVPHTIQRENMPPWMFRRERTEVRRPMSLGSPPRSRVEDTILDLCDPDFPGSDLRTPADWIADAVQKRLTTTARLRRVLAGRRKVPRRRLLESLLDDVGAGAQSRLELTYLNDVERPHGLPRGTRQRSTRNRVGRSFQDVRYEDYGVIAELDGVSTHAGANSFRDMRRDNAALLDGAVTLRYGRHDLFTDPCGVAWQVGELLIGRGWQGMVTSCLRCRDRRSASG
ncbi:Transcriptional regulator, AbiEi antitoxin, Type IV TA system [Microlunatus soli]|uniref:Transcriptional regulator, AbiEi antitoxin, Type IV TA system n=1 Tax=Microlunatus soli TaxID=630515 RepID=A0A1H1T3B2_9ACTN|nr:type IV toxin-antitoxin system AbiEi family antitoxin domain-containing protein [Microlunatus soli]SDS54476.1 Transcriptional regulator, AbiEi antitoxin, Type IV TA system [Microlunatus soli]